MNTMTDVPQQDVPSVVEEALRSGAKSVTVTIQFNHKYTVSWK